MEKIKNLWDGIFGTDVLVSFSLTCLLLLFLTVIIGLLVYSIHTLFY